MIVCVTPDMREWAAENTPDADLEAVSQAWLDAHQDQCPWPYPVSVTQIMSWMSWMDRANAASREERFDA